MILRNSMILMLVVTFSSTALFTSCKKEGCTDSTATNYDEDADDDDGSCVYPMEEDDIEFMITNPAAGSTFSMGDTVHIDAMITSSGEVHGYEVYLRNTSHNDEVVFQLEEHAHESPIHIHDMWVNNVMHHSDMELEIVLLVTHEGETESEKVSFHCHPM